MELILTFLKIDNELKIHLKQLDHYFVMIKLNLGIKSCCHTQGVGFTTKMEREGGGA